MRSEAIKAAYESARDRFQMSAGEFEKEAARWDVEPVEVEGKVVGAVMMKGEEIHACIKPEGFRRWLSTGVLRKTLVATLTKYGRAVTSVKTGNEVGRKFVERLGFAPFLEKDGVTWYEVRNGN